MGKPTWAEFLALNPRDQEITHTFLAAHA